MAERSSEPIHSTRSDDETLERLDGFVVRLGEHIDGIQEADRTGDLEAAAKRAVDLAEEADPLGLPALVAAARAAAASCGTGDAECAHGDIVELTDVVQRVRLGHRGGL